MIELKIINFIMINLNINMKQYELIISHLDA